MDKIKTVKIKEEDGSVSQESYYISADARCVDMANGYNLQETIGTIDIENDGNIAEQLMKKAYFFNTVIDMKNAKLKIGDYVCTLGYYMVNDGGGAKYRIVNGNHIDDGGNYHKLNNNLYAELIIKDGIVNLDWYGAYGDGIHNDSLAIQKAFESNYKIIFGYKKTYLIGTSITIFNSIDVDFNYSTLIFKNTINLEANEISLGNYSYIGKDIVLNNVNCSNGIFKITSPTQKWSDSKTQYKLGFSSYVKNNYLANPFDYDCTGEAIYCPYTYFNFKNIGDIRMYQNTDTTLTAFNVKGRVVNGKNIYAKEYGSLTLFWFSYCNVIIRDANLSSTIRALSNAYYYAFVIDCCSKWTLENIQGLSDWHVATTGGANGVSYNGIISNCVFKQYENHMYAYVEHENSYGTHLLNSQIDGVIINNGLIENCFIDKKCMLGASFYEQYKRDTKIINSTINVKENWYILRTEFFNNDYYYGNVEIDNCKILFYYGAIVPFTSTAHYYKCGKLIFNNNEFINYRDTSKLLLSGQSVDGHWMFSEIYINNSNINDFRLVINKAWEGCTLFINNCDLNVVSDEPAFFYATGLNINIKNSVLRGAHWNCNLTTQELIFYNSLVHWSRNEGEKYYSCRRTDTYEIIPDSINSI